MTTKYMKKLKNVLNTNIFFAYFVDINQDWQRDGKEKSEERRADMERGGKNTNSDAVKQTLMIFQKWLSKQYIFVYW